MKTKWTLLFVILSVLFKTNAQEVDTFCKDNFDALLNHINLLDYEAAAEPLNLLRDKCPKFSDKIYVYGETVLRYNIDIATEEEKQTALDDLFLLFSQYDKNFPGNSSNTAVKKALVLKNYNMATDAEIYKILDAAFITKKSTFIDFNAIDTYFSIFMNRFESGDKEITLNQLVEKYQAISMHSLFVLQKLRADRQALLNKQETLILSKEERQALKDLQQAIDAFQIIEENMNASISNHVSCDELAKYYEANFETNKNDIFWLQNIVSVLMNKKCYSNPVIDKSAVLLHQIKPTSQSAYNLGNLALRKNKTDEAVGYYNDAVRLEKHIEKKAKLYYNLANIFRNSDKKQAKEYAVKATELNPKSASSYILLADLYSTAGKECGFTNFEKKALNWLAIENIKKAGEAEKKYAKAIDKLLEKYTKNLPTKQEIKNAGLKTGKQITVGCWVNETITIPNS